MTGSARRDRRTGPGTATALFADVSGFTALADRVEVDELHEIIHPVIAALTAVAERHGGLLVKYGGDAVLVVFGAPIAADDHAVRALHAAQEMHAELDRLRPLLPAAGRQLTLHIGVASGPAPTGIGGGSGDAVLERAVLGETLLLAQRVESATPSGRTYASAATVELAAGAFLFEPVDDDPPGAIGPVSRLLRPVGRREATPAGDAAVAALRAVASGGSATPTAMGDERRLITAVFIDVAAGDLSASATAAIVQRLTSIADRYEGHVARYAGDALLVFFGAPLAHDDDAVRAVLTACEMHAAAADTGVSIRIGINSGHVVAGHFGGDVRADFSVLGDTVNVAQRLQAAAPVGCTYIGELTCRLTEQRFTLEPLAGGLHLKGKAEAVPAWRVVGPRSGPSRREGGVGRFVGRSQELARLTAVLDEVAAGRGAVVSIVGEPGVGKTRLLEETRRLAISRGVRWLGARCLSYGSSIAYWPYGELLRRTFALHVDLDPVIAANRLRERLREAEVEDAAPYFARLLGLHLDDEGEDVTALGAEAFQRGLHRAFGRWLRAIATTGPTVLAIEDVHWLDASSAALTAELARTLADVPLLIEVTARTEGDRVLGDLVDDDLARLERLELAPFDESDVATLLESILGGPPPSRLVDTVRARTSGNPLFAIEVVRASLDTGALQRTRTGWRLRDGWDARTVPTTVEGVLSARIDALPLATARVLTTASVIGRQVRLRLLRGVSGDVADLQRRLDELVERGFLGAVADDPESVAFEHALIQDVAYSRLVRRRRRQLHARVADVAEALYGSGDDVIDLLARHRYLGGGGASAIDALLRAGARARDLYALDQAALHLSRAIELLRHQPGSDERLLDVLLELAAVQERNGAYDAAAAAYSEVRDRRGDGESWRGLASTARRRGEYDTALHIVDDALRVLDRDGVALRGLLLERGWSLAMLGRYADARSVLEKALGADLDREDATTGHLLVQLAQVETLIGDYDAAGTHADQARELFERLRSGHGVAAANREIGSAHFHAGRVELAVVAYRRALDDAIRCGSVDEVAGGMLNLSMAEFSRGNLTDALALDQQAVEEFERIGHGSGRAIGYGNLAEKLLAAGRVDEALAWCARALAHAERIGHVETLADAGRTRARALMMLGYVEDAVAAADEAATRFAELGWDEAAASCRELAATALTG